MLSDLESVGFQSRGRKSISSGGFSHVAGLASAVAVSVTWQD
jgi:hypothetical protein